MKTQRLLAVILSLWAAGCALDDPPESAATTAQALSIQYVQGNFFSEMGSALQSSTSVAFPGAQTRGNLNVVSVSWLDAKSNVSSLTDSAGNTYQRITGASAAYPPGPGTIVMFYASNIVAATSNTVTAHFNAGVPLPEVMVAEYSGADPVAPLDVGAARGGNTTTSDSGPLTTAVPNELLVSTNVVLHTTTGPGTGFTKRFITPDQDILEDRIATTVGQYDGTAPLTAPWWVAAMAAFKPALVADAGSDATTDAPADSTSDVGPEVDATDATADGRDADSSTVVSGVAFPITTAPGKRYLVDQNGAAFLVKGDSPWQLITTLPSSELPTYVADRQLKGFNSLLVQLIDNLYTAGSTGANANGDLPFMRATDGTPYTNARTQLADFSTPNPPYWAAADQVLAYLSQRGILVFLYPTWLGFNGGGPNMEGYYPAMVANGTATLQGYGRFVAQRYGGLPNIIWTMGGDYNPPDKTGTEAIANGIRQLDTVHLMSADCADGTSPLDFWTNEPWLTLNNVYTDSQLGHPFVYQKSFAEYQETNWLPFFLKEACYEGDNNAPARLIRQQAYEGLLSGGSGEFYGSEGLWELQPGWQAFLNTRAALDMQQFNSLFTSRRWELLAPDIANVFVTNGASYSGAQHVAAARAADGSWGVAYVPGTQQVIVDLSGFAHGVDGYWFDPTSGSMTMVTGSPFANVGSLTLTPPGANGTGDADWVLVLE
jgi:hypothetical protein